MLTYTRECFFIWSRYNDVLLLKQMHEVTFIWQNKIVTDKKDNNNQVRWNVDTLDKNYISELYS